MEQMPSYYAVIPATVRYDKELRPNAKLLYGELSALTVAKGYCWANNAYFAELFGLSKKTVGELIAQLAKRGYIRTEVIRDEETNEVIERRIWIAEQSCSCAGPVEPKEETEKEEPGEGCPQKPESTLPKNVEENNTSKNNTRNNILSISLTGYAPEGKENNTFVHLCSILSKIEVTDDARAAGLAVVSALEANGYICQSGAPVPTRGGGPKYTGRIGIVAAKDGTVIAMEIDRKSARKKSLYKLTAYPCDFRLVLLMGGEERKPPEGIDAVIPLHVKDGDDSFHTFWDAYPKKVNKQRAYEVFKRLKVTPELLGKMLYALNAQKQGRQWRESDGRFIPHASTWLNGRRWEDDPAEYAVPEDRTKDEGRTLPPEGAEAW